MRSGWLLALLLAGCAADLDQRALPIVGGAETTEWPEVGALTWDGDFLCSGVLVGLSGSLLGRRYLLSMAISKP